MRGSGHITLLACGVLLAAGCRQEEITHVRVPRQVSSPAPGATARVLRWSVPAGWTELPGSGSRAATLRPPGEGPVEVSILVLPGAAGGELANVNRWREQLGLAPLDAAALAKARAVVSSPAGPVSVFDLAAPGTEARRIVGALLPAGDRTWFLKLAGPSEAVAGVHADFLRLLEEVRLE